MIFKRGVFQQLKPTPQPLMKSGALHGQLRSRSIRAWMPATPCRHAGGRLGGNAGKLQSARPAGRDHRSQGPS